jgi:hypothetical protein
LGQIQVTFFFFCEREKKNNNNAAHWFYLPHCSRHGERLGLSAKVVPAIAIENPTSGKHWAFDESATVTVDAVSAWVAKFLDGSLSETIRSEEIPTTQEGLVRKVRCNDCHYGVETHATFLLCFQFFVFFFFRLLPRTLMMLFLTRQRMFSSCSMLHVSCFFFLSFFLFLFLFLFLLNYSAFSYPFRVWSLQVVASDFRGVGREIEERFACCHCQHRRHR